MAEPARWAASGGRPSPAVGVVVCTYDLARFEQLGECLRSLREQTLRPAEVVVVVDGCAAVAAALRHRDGPETIVELDPNQGLSAARNAGVRRISAPWVAFLDDDATADPRWLERLVSCAEEAGAAGAGGWSEPAFDTRVPRWFPPELWWTVGCSYRGMSRERTVHRNVFGGCAVLKRDLFDLVGGYDEALGRRGADCSGGEEADFCLRVSAADPAARFVHVPDAVIHHRVGGSRLTRRYVINRCFSDGRTKSLIARRSTGTGLRPEWRYLIRTVPLGVLRALVTGRWQAAAVLAAGVVGAGAGYLAGRTRWRRVIRRSPAPAGQS